VSGDRIIIGGTDCTDRIAAHIAVAPALNAAQSALIRHLFATARTARAARLTAERAERKAA